MEEGNLWLVLSRLKKKKEKRKKNLIALFREKMYEDVFQPFFVFYNKENDQHSLHLYIPISKTNET